MHSVQMTLNPEIKTFEERTVAGIMMELRRKDVSSTLGEWRDEVRRLFALSSMKMLNNWKSQELLCDLKI